MKAIFIFLTFLMFSLLIYTSCTEESVYDDGKSIVILNDGTEKTLYIKSWGPATLWGYSSEIDEKEGNKLFIPYSSIKYVKIIGGN